MLGDMADRIAHIISNVGSIIARHIPTGKDAALYAVVLSSILGAWSLGRLSVQSSTLASSVAIENVFDKATDRFECQVSIDQVGGAGHTNQGVVLKPAPTEGAVVGSKNGSKYHHQWCSGVKSIKEENKVWFESVAAAEAAGYTQAGNCK